MPPLPLRYRLLRGLVRLVVRVFFREVTVEGRDRVPGDRGGVLVAWHPNGLIDPALILSAFPGRVVFGARDGLLRWPVVGPLIRALAVPIYRPQDGGERSEAERRAANAASLGALADAVAGGAFAALFPEGVSHDRPHLAEIRSGAARLVEAAHQRTEAGGPPPTVVPVGLHYAAKGTFRTDALVVFHAPLALPAPLPGADARARADALTDAIEDALERAVRPTADWETHRLMHRVRSLLDAEAAARRGERPAPDTLAAREAGFSRVWAGYQVRRETHPAEIEALREEVAAYDARLHTLGLDDASLDRAPLLGSPFAVVGAGLQAALVVALLPPLLVLGVAVNAGPWWALKGLARLAARAEKDVATVKIFGGLVLFPLAWAAAGALAALGVVGLAEAFPRMPEAPLAAGAVVAALSAVGGVAALLAAEVVGGAWRAVGTRVARWRHADRLGGLRRQRAELHDRFAALAVGLGAAGPAA